MSKTSARSGQTVGLKVLAIAISALLVVIRGAYAQGGPWTAKAPMPTPRNSLSIAVVDGLLYAMGGENFASGQALATVEAFYPKSDTWVTKASLPTPCWGAAAGVVNNIIYLVGCRDLVGPRATYAYDPKNNSWSTKAPMPTPRQIFGVAVVDGILYTIGGVTIAFNNGNHAAVEAYDPRTDTWTAKPSMPTARCCMAVGVIDGLIYVAGGTRFIGHGGIETPATLEVYNPKTDSWTTRALMPTGRGGSAGAVVAGRMYVIGGILAPLGTEQIQATVEVYDPETDSWITELPMPTARTALAAGAVEDTIFALGGIIRDARSVSINEAFSPFLHVAIDIKPGDARNTINLKSQGVVGVAILGSGMFDPLSVDPSSVTLAGAPVATRGRGVPMTSQGDFNHDGYLDLLLYFRTQTLQLDSTATEAVLYGTTTTGQRIRGADSVRIIQFTIKGPAPRAPFERPRRAPDPPFEP